MATVKEEPDYLDEVKNSKSGVTGVVDAIYTLAGIKYIDIIVDDCMNYKCLASNWEVTVKYVP